MKNELSEVAREVLAVVKRDITTLTDKLSVSVLDGSPMLLIIKREGIERVYGEWNGIKGYMASELVPATLCGCIMMSPENAQSNVNILHDTGIRAYSCHWRQFAQVRLTALKALEKCIIETTLPVVS